MKHYECLPCIKCSGISIFEGGTDAVDADGNIRRIVCKVCCSKDSYERHLIILKNLMKTEVNDKVLKLMLQQEIAETKAKTAKAERVMLFFKKNKEILLQEKMSGGIPHDNRREYGVWYRKNNQEKIKKYRKEYQRKHKDRLRVANERYRQKHKERIAAYTKKYREKNKERIAAYAKKYREKNKEKLRAQSRERTRKYRERKKQNGR